MTRTGGAMLSRRGRVLIPLARLDGPMPWVIAILMLLTVLAAAAGLTTNGAASALDAELAGGVTVQIVEPARAERLRQREAALAVLRDLPFVTGAAALTERQAEALVAPWLGGDGAAASGLPVPALIDVQLGAPADDRALQALRGALGAVAPAARVDANAGWIAPVRQLLDSLRLLALALVALLAVATSAAVLLAARAALNAHRGTIEIVHLMGATDRQITRLFQQRIAMDALVGALLGFAVAIAMLLLLAGQVARIGSGMLATGGLGPLDWLILALLPVTGALLALLTARLAVMRALRTML